MTRTALITVHGMGRTPTDYAQDLLKRLKPHLGPRFLDLVCHPVYYQGLLQPNEDEVWRRCAGQASMHYDALRQFLLYGFADAAGLESRKDEPDSVYALSQLEVARALFQASQSVGLQGPVVLLTQSLGCQVLSNYFYDAQKARQHGPQAVRAGIWADLARYETQIAGRPLSEAEQGFIAGHTCRRWLSTGCNIPIFLAAHRQLDIRPIQPPPGHSADFRWLNLYDADDVLGWPMAPLSEAYGELVEDRAINAGRGLVGWLLKSWTPASHTAYWTDDDVLGPLAQMLGEFL